MNDKFFKGIVLTALASILFNVQHSTSGFVFATLLGISGVMETLPSLIEEGKALFKSKAPIIIALMCLPLFGAAQTHSDVMYEKVNTAFWLMAFIAATTAWTLGGWIWYTSKNHPEVRVPPIVMLFGPFSGYLKKTVVVLLLCLPLLSSAQSEWLMKTDGAHYSSTPKEVYNVDIYTDDITAETYIGWDMMPLSQLGTPTCRSWGFIATDGDETSVSWCDANVRQNTWECSWIQIVLDSAGEIIAFTLYHENKDGIDTNTYWCKF